MGEGHLNRSDGGVKTAERLKIDKGGEQRGEGGGDHETENAAPHERVFNSVSEEEVESEPDYHESNRAEREKPFCSEIFWFRAGLMYTTLLGGFALIELGGVDLWPWRLLAWPGGLAGFIALALWCQWRAQDF